MTSLNQTALEEARHLLAELEVFHANDAGDRAIRILRSLVETPSTPSPEAITSEELIQRTGGSCGPVDTRGFPPELREPSPLSALEPSPASVPAGARVTDEMVRDGCVGIMTPERAIYFLERFKREEKLLGPHEQWALDFAIAALTQPASGGLWTREDLAQGLAMLDGITLREIKSTVGPADDANNWREYLGRADDLLAHLSRATSPREAEGEACAAPEQGGENNG